MFGCRMPPRHCLGSLSSVYFTDWRSMRIIRMTFRLSSSAGRRTSPTITLHAPRPTLTTQLLEADGGSVRAGVVAKRLGTSVALVDVLRQAGRLLAVQVEHGFLYPVWQFEGRGQLAGLPTVLEALAGL